MNRELSKREKILLLILVLMVLALGYFKLLLEPINDQIASLRANTDIEQTQLQTDSIRLAQLEQMRAAIAAIKATGEERAIPQYDNDERLMADLQTILSSTLHCTVDCTAGTTQDGYLMLRPVVLTYTTATYAQSRAIIDALSGSDNVNYLSNVDVSFNDKEGTYETTLAVTFFEIMP